MSNKSKLSNSAAMGIISDAEITTQAKLAFANNAQSKLLEGSAVQRLAFAVTAEHHAMVQAGKKLGLLSSIFTSPENLKAIRDAMVKFFIGEAEDHGEGKTDKGETAKASRNGQTALMGRAIQLAGILARANIGLADFNRSTGNFPVPTKLLLKKGETAFGRLASTDTIPLDGKPILVSGKNSKGVNAMLTLRASVARLVDVNAPAKGRGATGSGDKPGFKEQVVAVGAALKNEKSPIYLHNLTSDLKNELAGIAKWYAEQVQLEDSAANAKKADIAAKAAARAKADKPNGKPAPVAPSAPVAA